ncbi:MAG: hypothetical protein IJX38_03270 [Clostridia bacterium]|nr:hypothetical protein [Clostridia bacterium]
MTEKLKISRYSVTEQMKAQLETELRFDIASAKADGADLIELKISLTDDERLDNRILNFITRILGVIMREELIQFYATPRGFETGTKEALFLQNKYPEYLRERTEEYYFVYIKTP